MSSSATTPREVRVSFPSELVAELGGEDAAVSAQVLEALLIDLFRQGRITSGYAAEVLGIARHVFFDVLAQHNVPYFDADDETARADREAIEAYSGHGPRRST